MKVFRLNLLLALVVAVFLALWGLPLSVLLLPRPSKYLVSLMILVFGTITGKIWRAWRSIPDALQPKVPPGMQLRESDAPELFAIAAKVRAQTGMNSVVECWCDISPTISAVAYAEHVASEAKIALRNGIAALAVMTRTQVETLLRYHLTILTFSPRLMSMALKGRMVSQSFFYFTPYVQLFNAALRRVEEHARGRAANREETSAAIKLSREVAIQFQVFWATGVQPFLQTGYLMPIAEGFSMFWRANHAEAEQRPAIDMVEASSRIETKLTAELLKANPGIERASWEQARVILLESWRQTASEQSASLQGVMAGELCDGRERTPVLMMGLAAALDRAGWRFQYAGPGSKVAFAKEGKQVEPFQVDCADWADLCEQSGITRLPLG